MRAHHIAVVLKASLVHLLQVGGVGHHFGRRGAGRRQPGADHDRIRVGLLDARVGDAEQAGVLLRVGRLSAPFARQVGLVPDLVGLDAALVARGHRIAKVAKVLVTLWWAIRGACSGPARRPVQPSDHLEPGLLGHLHDLVGLGPVIVPFFGPLDVGPREHLFDPSEPHIFD